MTAYRFFIFAVILLTISLVGCTMKPQIISPRSEGFSPNEYLVIEAKTKSRLGQLYEAIQETDEKGRKLPLRWQETTLLLFPQGNDVNQVEESSIEQTRSAVETTGTSGKLTVAAFVTLDGEKKSAFKYQAKVSKFSQLKMPLQYNHRGIDYMRSKLQKDTTYRFAYLSALYEGTAFTEIFNNVATHGAGNYAAFQIEGDYYVTSNTGIITAGPIIYQVLQVDLDQFSYGVEAEKEGVEFLMERRKKSGVEAREKKFAPLTGEQLGNIIKSAPEEVRKMIKPQ